MRSIIINKGLINMKVPALSIVQRSSKKTKRPVTRLEAIPTELLSDVLARVASDSFTDMLNAKMSCKDFYTVSEDPYVYKNVSLESIPIVAWTPITDKQQIFLAKCEEYDNPECLYRQAVVNYFNEQTSESTLKYLDKACELGHVGAGYAKCIVMLFSDDNEIRKEGVKLLSTMKKNGCSGLKVGRNKLFDILSWIWVKNSSVRNRPVFCTTQDDHMNRKGNWACEDEEEGIHCAACIADKEISLITRLFPQL